MFVLVGGHSDELRLREHEALVESEGEVVQV